jgi:hypothetical protein
MIEDEFGPKSVSDDIRSQGARPVPREINVGELVVVVIVVAVTAILIWLL